MQKGRDVEYSHVKVCESLQAMDNDTCQGILERMVGSWRFSSRWFRARPTPRTWFPESQRHVHCWGRVDDVRRGLEGSYARARQCADGQNLGQDRRSSAQTDTHHHHHADDHT